MKFAALILALSISLPALASVENKPLVVHEWGTFTSLQDETGRALGAINSNDEPLPPFVHRIGDVILNDFSWSKGAPKALTDVTMRLETPVVYFYPPSGTVGPIQLDVTAEFHGGLLSEFYPGAQGALLPAGKIHITEKTNGKLSWHNLLVGTGKDGPKTDSHVWLAPRAPQAASVTTAGGESERYLFYRGIGHLDAPLRVVRHGENLEIDDQRSTDRMSHGEPIQTLWLAEFAEDGSCAFRSITAAQARTLEV